MPRGAGFHFGTPIALHAFNCVSNGSHSFSGPHLYYQARFWEDLRMPTDIREVVLALPRETVLEAATFVAEELAPDAEPESEASWIGSQPFTRVGDVEALARLILLGRALEGSDGLAEVESAIDG